MDNDVEIIRHKLTEILTADKQLSHIFPLTGDLKHAKFSRARFLMKNARDNNIDSEQALDAALGIEIVHLASLIHDDVIDEAEMRRHQENLKAAKGDKSAVLYGDYLFSTAVKQIQTTQNADCAQLFVQSINDMCRGEAVQDLLLTDPDYSPTLEDVQSVARGKTGALFSFCAAAPAWIITGQKAELKQALKEIGFLLGLAYQIVDDILDITGVEKNLGKPAGNDLQKNCLTTPLFMMMQDSGLNWSAFRHYYLESEHSLKEDFLQSNTLTIAQQQLAKIKQDLADNVAICQQNQWQIEALVSIFWQRYVEQRMSLLRDFN
ncbi:MAG: hypothetical protein GQ582_01705 [Methyloprofundus sp.]|nr:hypothetical protein [Methyloprofundus sp.]